MHVLPSSSGQLNVGDLFVPTTLLTFSCSAIIAHWCLTQQVCPP